nr:DDE-type integrase/transposase/recombinase [Legionella sp. MW5194]
MKIEEWTRQGVQASTIYAHLQREHGFKSSYSVVQRYIKSYKEKQRAVTTILEFKPGESAQVDFGQGPKITDGKGEEQKTWIFVMVLSWSRHMYAEMVLHQDVETWLACHRRAFEWFNGVPEKIIIDNAKCAITKLVTTTLAFKRHMGSAHQAMVLLFPHVLRMIPRKKAELNPGLSTLKTALFHCASLEA